jgi:hypothetical protein
MKFPWQRNGHTDVHTVTIIVNTDELMQLETEAVQERMSIPEYVRAKVFAKDLTPQIRQMFENMVQLDERFRQLAETLGQMADLEEKKNTLG